MLVADLTNTRVERLTRVVANQHVVADVELFAVGLDLVPRRIAQHGVEAAGLVERGSLLGPPDLGKLQFPMEECLSPGYLLGAMPPRSAPQPGIDLGGLGVTLLRR